MKKVRIEVSFVCGLLSGRGHAREPVGELGMFSVLIWAVVMWVETYVSISAQEDLMHFLVNITPSIMYFSPKLLT